MMAIKPGTIRRHPPPFFSRFSSRYNDRFALRLPLLYPNRVHSPPPKISADVSKIEHRDRRSSTTALLFNLDDRRTVGPASSSLIFLVGIYHYTHDRRLQSLSLLNRIFRTLEKRSYFTQEVDVLFSSPSGSWMMIDRRDGR